MKASAMDEEFEELFKKAVQEIASNHRKIIDDWCKAYLAQLYEEDIDIKPNCFTLFQKEIEGGYKYWFEYTPKAKKRKRL
jgi:uncharacterized protein YecA (UPF0149 family)